MNPSGVTSLSLSFQYKWTLKVASILYQRECIPVGCVPSAAVVVGGGVCPGGCLPHMPLSSIYPWRWCLPRVVSVTHTPDPESARGCLPRDGCLPGGWQTPPTQCMLGYSPLPCPVHAGIHTTPTQCMLGYTPPLDRMTDACENITFPQLHCGRSKSGHNEQMPFTPSHPQKPNTKIAMSLQSTKIPLLCLLSCRVITVWHV